jgi:hypothetical protein
VNDYIEQLIMMNDENGAVGASDTGPSAGYTFVFLFLFTDFLVWLADNKMEYIYTHTLPRNHHPSAFQKKKVCCVRYYFLHVRNGSVLLLRTC